MALAYDPTWEMVTVLLKILGSMTYLTGVDSMGTRLSIVQEKGEITIPVEIREYWGLRKGDMVTSVETEQGVLISPQKVVAMNALDRIGKALQERGINLEELIESGRDIRGQFLEEGYDLKAREGYGSSSCHYMTEDEG